jgi:predicted RNA binding protein YcfA (HicA-like mRNA interferase family)
VLPIIIELVAMLSSAGYVNRGGRGSHRNFVHPGVAQPVTLSGHDGDDAKPYQVRAVRRAIAEAER